MTSLKILVENHVNYANRIFADQIFEGDYEHLYFRLAHTQVMFGSCEGFEKGDKNCTSFTNKFLEFFDSRYNFSSFCLAYMFTDR